MNKKSNKILIVNLLALLGIQGCVFLSEEVATLKEVGKSQAQIVEYIERQEKLFEKLLDDLKNERLVVGTSKSTIMNLYGEPILSKEAKKPPPGEILLFRYPTRYFDSDKVYLRFDKADELIGWKHKPYDAPTKED